MPTHQGAVLIKGVFMQPGVWHACSIAVVGEACQLLDKFFWGVLFE